MGEQTPAGLPQFLRFLAALPNPDAVARSLQLGPLALFDFGAMSIVRVVNDTLVLTGAHGYTHEEIDRYYQVPLTMPTPFSRCVQESEVLIDEIETVLDSFSALKMDEDFWNGFMARMGVGQVVSAPILSQGIVIGVYGGITRTKREWTSQDIALINGLSAALGLWMTNPDAPVPRPDRLENQKSAAICLSPRQQQILMLVEEGHSNASISHTLGFSVSTVKQELQKAMRATRVTDRSHAATRARELNLLPNHSG